MITFKFPNIINIHLKLSAIKIMKGISKWKEIPNYSVCGKLLPQARTQRVLPSDKQSRSCSNKSPSV